MSDGTKDVLTAAFGYASQGIYVFPVRIGVRGDGKKDVHPIADWKAASSTDPDTITSWFTGAWAGAALAIDCGKSGLVGIDQDVSDGKEGPANWAGIEHTPTARVRTPSGGLHDYYRADPDHLFTGDNTGAVADGIDTRGLGGFLFAPPSLDPRGGSWEWEEGVPDFGSLPIVPEVVVKRMEAARADKRPKASQPVTGSPFVNAESSQLFGGNYGDGAGGKTASKARELLDRERRAFLALTDVGNGRSHILAQNLAVLAGHGVDVFWSYQDAQDALLAACRENGFADEHGEAYALQQLTRGLEYGMREPWQPLAEQTAEAVTPDEVDALIAEMISPEEIANRPPPRPLIRGLLNLDSESWIIGEPGSKKSFVATDMAAHVARGMTWQGLKVAQANVVMIIAEGAGGMSSRVKAWQAVYGPMTDVHILPRPVQAKDVRAWAVLVKACARLAPGLIVLDTQARVTVGLEENSATEMGMYVEAVRALREATGACVLTVHHTGRKGGDARGSSAIDGAQHTELKVEPDVGNALRARLVTEKQKDIEKHPAIHLAFKVEQVGVDEDGEIVSSLVLDPDAWNNTQHGEAARGDEPGREIQVREPEPWTWTLFDHNRQDAKRRILQTIKDLAGDAGRTEAQIRKAVAERWYGGQVGRTGGTLSAQTWDGHWTGVLAASWAEGKVVVPGGVGGWMISPDYLVSG